MTPNHLSFWIHKNNPRSLIFRGANLDTSYAYRRCTWICSAAMLVQMPASEQLTFGSCCTSRTHDVHFPCKLKFSKIVGSLFEEILSKNESYLISTFWDLQLLFDVFFVRTIGFLKIWKKGKKGDLNPQNGRFYTFLGRGIYHIWENTSKHISPAILVLPSLK